MFIKCLKHSRVMGGSRETQNLVPALKELLAVLEGNHWDTSADITGVHHVPWGPFEILQKFRERFNSGRKPVSLASAPPVSGDHPIWACTCWRLLAGFGALWPFLSLFEPGLFAHCSGLFVLLHFTENVFHKDCISFFSVCELGGTHHSM